MSYINIQSFKYGLDSRKSELTSQPGTLVKLENAHVNQGGEVSKRYKFTRFYTTDLAATFGLQFTSNGAVVFGSAATPASLTSWPTFGTPATLTFPVSYMRLQHPDEATAITSVTTVCVYSDIPLVVALFADGNSYTFYNGAIVNDFIAGVVADFMKTAGVVDKEKIARHLETLVNETAGYTATQNAQFADGSNILGVTKNAFSISDTVTTAGDGDLLALPNSAGTPSYDGQGATGSFIIYAAIDTLGQITSVKYGTTELLLGTVTVNSDGDINKFAQDVCQMINANAASGFTAYATNNMVTISAPTATAAALTVTGNKVCIGDYNVTLAGNLTVTALTINSVSVLTEAQYAFPQLTATVTSVTWAANVMTINTSAAHNLVVGAKITLTGTNATYNTGGGNPTTWTCAALTTGTVIKVTRTGSGTTYTGAGTVFLSTSYNSITLLRSAIVADINAGASGYTAVDTLPITYISKKISASTDANLVVAWTVTGTGSVTVGGSNSLNASVNTTNIAIQWYDVGLPVGFKLTGPQVNCQVSGGTPPYTYKWVILTTVSAHYTFAYFSVPTGAGTSLVIAQASGGPPPLYAGVWTFRCNVTDSLNQTTQSGIVTASTGV